MITIKKYLRTGLVTNSAKALLLKILAATSAFLSTVVITRGLGLEGAGTYFLSLAIVSVAAVFCRIGLDNVVAKEIARLNHSEWLGAKKIDVYYTATSTVFVSATLTTAVLFLSADMFSDIFNIESMSSLLKIMSFSILPVSLLNLNAMSFRGIKKFDFSILSQDVMVPSLLLCLSIPLMSLFEQNGIGIAYLLSTIVAAILSTWLWRPSLLNWRFDWQLMKRLWGSSQHLFPASIVNRGVLPFAPVFFLGAMSSTEQVAIFSAISRVAMIVAIVIVAIGSVVAPSFSSMYSNNNFKALGLLSKKAAFLTSTIVVPSCLLIGINSTLIMSLFGAEFVLGSLGLQILLLGRCLGACFGAQDQLLLMSSQERWFKISSYFAVVVLVVFSLVFIPSFGATGAALALSFSYIISSILNAYFVSSKVGVNSYAFGIMPLFKAN